MASASNQKTEVRWMTTDKQNSSFYCPKETSLKTYNVLKWKNWKNVYFTTWVHGASKCCYPNMWQNIWQTKINQKR